MENAPFPFRKPTQKPSLGRVRGFSIDKRLLNRTVLIVPLEEEEVRRNQRSLQLSGGAFGFEVCIKQPECVRAPPGSSAALLMFAAPSPGVCWGWIALQQSSAPAEGLETDFSAVR